MQRGYRKGSSESSRRGRIMGVETDHVTVELALPMAEVLAETEAAVERLAGEAGLLMMAAAMESEVERLAGPRYEHRPDREASRWGRQRGWVMFGGQKVQLSRPRVRGRDGTERGLSTYRLFQRVDRLRRVVADRIMLGLSARNYRGAVGAFVDGYGIEKSSVSRHFVEASAEKLSELMERPLGGLELAVVMIDGIRFAEHLLVVALGIDTHGAKHVLGLWQGATENAVVCKALLEDLVERGFDCGEHTLFVIDGSKALRKSIDEFFGDRALIQRCQKHKRENVRGHLAKADQSAIDARILSAYRMDDYDKAKTALEQLARELEWINPSAATSLREGLDETLTVVRLGLPESIAKSLRTTNTIESCFATTRRLTRNVTRWQGGNMVQRWSATALLIAEKKFRRINGYKAMPLLVSKLRAGQETETLAA